MWKSMLALVVAGVLGVGTLYAAEGDAPKEGKGKGKGRQMDAGAQFDRLVGDAKVLTKEKYLAQPGRKGGDEAKAKERREAMWTRLFEDKTEVDKETFVKAMEKMMKEFKDKGGKRKAKEAPKEEK